MEKLGVVIFLFTTEHPTQVFSNHNLNKELAQLDNVVYFSVEYIWSHPSVTLSLNSLQNKQLLVKVLTSSDNQEHNQTQQ